MKLDVPYRILGDVELTLIEGLVPRQFNPAWHHPNDDWRSKTHTHHKDTVSLVFRWVWSMENGRQEEFEIPGWTAKMHEVEVAVGRLVGVSEAPIRTIVACLKPGGSIEPHQDNQQWFKDIHRIHIPLHVPTGCHFYVSGVEVPMKRGQAIEISNLDFHEVRNDSAEERYHIIMDFVDAGLDVDHLAE